MGTPHTEPSAMCMKQSLENKCREKPTVQQEPPSSEEARDLVGFAFHVPLRGNTLSMFVLWVLRH